MDTEAYDPVIWEALSAAAVVRYARCFNSGKRDRLKHDLFNAAPQHVKEAHEYFIAVRSKHVAHSVNVFEENDVTVTVNADRFVGSMLGGTSCPKTYGRFLARATQGFAARGEQIEVEDVIAKRADAKVIFAVDIHRQATAERREHGARHHRRPPAVLDRASPQSFDGETGTGVDHAARGIPRIDAIECSEVEH